MPAFRVEQARAFLGWRQRDLGDASGLSFETIRDFERLKRSAPSKNIAAIRVAFHHAGVDFQKHGERVAVTIVVPGLDV